jgi:hypothetical protein
VSSGIAGLEDVHRRYLLRESLISSIINVILSVAIFTALFRDQPAHIFGGSSQFTLDFLAQAFFVGFFSALPPSLLTRKRLKSSEISALPGRPLFGINSAFLRSLVLGVAALFAFGGLTLAVAAIVPLQTIGFQAAVIAKAVFAIAVSMVFTPVAIIATLREEGMP